MDRPVSRLPTIGIRSKDGASCHRIRQPLACAPGAEDEAASLLDAYLARADTASRLAQLTGDRSGIGARLARILAPADRIDQLLALESA
jgi:hypothetical protein